MSRLQRLELEALKESYKELSKRLDDLEGGVKSQPKKPETLKVLDHSVFNGLDEKWRFAAINKAGRLVLSKSTMASDENYWYSYFAGDLYGKDTGYDASSWQDSLIKRESKELTGSDLARAMLARGGKYVMCLVSGMSDAKADLIPKAITSFNSLTRQFRANHDIW